MDLGRRSFAELAPGREELAQQRCAGSTLHTSEDIHAMPEAALAWQVNDAAAGSCLQVPSAENDACDPRCQQRTRAHRARFERYVNRRPLQAVILLLERRGAQRNDLGVGSWIMCAERLIPALTDHAAAVDNQCTNWYLAGIACTLSERKRAPHIVDIIAHPDLIP